MANAKVQVRRAYEDAAQGDGTRVLVEPELRKWYGHDPERFGDARRFLAASPAAC